MVEVTASNFSEYFSEIEEAIRQCDFIALDTEFTGLKIDDDANKPSLFDGGAERYAKLRETISKITICQLGISVFRRDQKQTSVYVAKTYNIPLFPRSFGPVDERFVCQASSLQFLCRYKFDFNKFIYEGLSFLNEDQERQVREHIASKAMFTGLERDLDEEALQRICSRVAEWLVSKDNVPVFTLQKSDMESFPLYVLSTELRGRFPTIWTTVDSNLKTIEVQRIDQGEREKRESEELTNQKQQEEQLVQRMLGFTRVFRVMKQCKKPLIGHNNLMDLMLVYDKFHLPLPASYTEFKSQLHAIFPWIYDTKHVIFRMRGAITEDTGLLQKTSLSEIYKELDSDKGRDLVIFPPAVMHAEGHTKYNGDSLPHEAGFDAFMCGFVFLRLAHIKTFKDVKSSEVIPCLFRRYLQSMEEYCNKVNIIRARINNISLDSVDYQSEKPELLFVRSRLMKKRLNIDQLAKWFSPYGNVDIRVFGKNRALAATNNFKCSRDILKAFRGHPTIYVAEYSIWRHSPLVRGILWSGAIVSGGLCILALVGSVKERKP
ncbi:poly(A)-specific ribonuclease PNLDC1-like [Dreissena polymorpha]|uniref:Uncharacterized protein n=1 Tax=Dreissena polymorpha TaxID=45954 RepID=A0A9D4MZS2_DREPO|nr:poly(A)-specific ribonuclease PNLDC1-like [Dreissena polymorpha]KAH3884679.1 hypothetical protein DPMN_008665 [Dreissena polymorpha]